MGASVMAIGCDSFAILAAYAKGPATPLCPMPVSWSASALNLVFTLGANPVC